MKENFVPSFKENDEEQFYFTDNNWIKCSESLIDSLWNSWVISKHAERYLDEDGFLIFGFSLDK